MPEKALRLFTVNARRFADEPFVYYDKAIALKALNKSEQARPLLEKAVKLVEKLNDDELESFRKALQQL